VDLYWFLFLAIFLRVYQSNRIPRGFSLMKPCGTRRTSYSGRKPCLTICNGWFKLLIDTFTTWRELLKYLGQFFKPKDHFSPTPNSPVSFAFFSLEALIGPTRILSASIHSVSRCISRWAGGLERIDATPRLFFNSDTIFYWFAPPALKCHNAIEFVLGWNLCMLD